MCGILFYIQRNNIDDLDKYALLALDSIKHRGPDTQNHLFVHPNIFLGFARLSIVNTSSVGNQPFQYNDKYLLGNGELYNMNRLRENLQEKSFDGNRNDIDAFGALWYDTNDFEQSIQRIDGDFAIVAYDAKRNIVYAGRDYVGVKPLFYVINDDVIAFASEAKALVALFSKEENKKYINEIKQFSPNTLWDSETNTFRPIFTPENYGEVDKSSLGEKLENAVLKRVQHGERQVGFLCSGGIDSSIVCFLAKKYTNIRAFTIKFGHYAPDAIYAHLLCKRMNINLTTISFTQQDIERVTSLVIHACETSDPITIRAAIPGYLLAEYISKNTDIKVILGGEGADELFQGYEYFKQSPSIIEAALEGERLIRNVHCYDLLRTERVFAAHGLEIRVPFLDKDFIEYSQALARHTPIMFHNKDILRQAFMNVPELSDVIIRPKERFSDGCGADLVSSIVRGLGAVNPEQSIEYEIQNRKEIFTKMLHIKDCEQLHIPRTMPHWDGLNCKTHTKMNLDYY